MGSAGARRRLLSQIEQQFPFVSLALFFLVVAILIALFALYFRWLLLGWPLDSGTAAWLVGAVWCAMTVLFEWGLGVRRGMTAGEIFAAYDLSSGQLWALIPLWVLVGPYVMRRWTGKENASVRR